MTYCVDAKIKSIKNSKDKKKTENNRLPFEILVQIMSAYSSFIAQGKV